MYHIIIIIVKLLIPEWLLVFTLQIISSIDTIWPIPISILRKHNWKQYLHRNMFFISLLIRTILLKTVIPSRYYFQSNFIEDIAYRSSDTWLDHSDLWWLLTIWQRTICSQLWFHWRYYRSSDTWLGHSDLSCLGSPSSDSGHPGPSHPRLHSQVTSLCHQCLWILWEVYIKPAWWWEVI